MCMIRCWMDCSLVSRRFESCFFNQARCIFRRADRCVCYCYSSGCAARFFLRESVCYHVEHRSSRERFFAVIVDGMRVTEARQCHGEGGATYYRYLATQHHREAHRERLRKACIEI